MAFDGVTCEDDGKVLKSQSMSAYINAFTDYGLFKNNIPGLDLLDERSYSTITVEFWLKLEKYLFIHPETFMNKDLIKMVRVDF